LEIYLEQDGFFYKLTEYVRGIGFKSLFYSFLIVFIAIGKSGGRSVPNMDVLRKHLLREGHLNKPEMMEIVQKGIEIMSKWHNFCTIRKIVTR